MRNNIKIYFIKTPPKKTHEFQNTTTNTETAQLQYNCVHQT